MGNLNDLLVSGDQASTTDDSAGAKPSIHPSSSDIVTFQGAHMEKVSPNKIDGGTVEASEIDKAPDKASAACAPKKRFLKDYQTEGSLSGSDASKRLTMNDKVSLLSNVVSKRDVNNANVVKSSLETLNISSCIGVIVESELTKYEMCKENSDTPRPNEKSVLPLLFTPYSDQTSDTMDDKYNQRSQLMPTLTKDKFYERNSRKSSESPNSAKCDVEIIACSPEIPSQQRQDKVKLTETERARFSSKSREPTPYETGTVKSCSPKCSPMNAQQSSLPMTNFPQVSQYLDEWKNLPASEKSNYSQHNLPYGMKHYHDLKFLKDAKSQSNVHFKTPSDPSFRRTEVQFSPKYSKQQPPREMMTSDNLASYSRDDIQGYVRGIDPRLYQNMSSEKYAHPSSQSSPQMRMAHDETPIDLRIKKKEKPLGYGGTISYDPPESKRLKFHGFSHDQSIKTSGQYYYLPADSEKGLHGSLASSSSLSSFSPAFLKTGEAETLKTYLSDQYNHSFSSRNSEVAMSKPKQVRSDAYPYRESYGTSKAPEENLNKSQMLEKWDRSIPRSGDQSRSISRRQHEGYEHDLMGSHYLKYFEVNRNQDPKSSSPRLIPQLLPISPMNHSRNNQPLNYFPSHDTQSFQCKLCSSVHSSYRSFRMHIVKDHNMEPHPEHCSLSVADVKASVNYGQDRAFPTHKMRVDGDGYHSVQKQVAEVYPIISKVPSSYTAQSGMSGIDHGDAKNKIPEKSKGDIKAGLNREGFDDAKQALPWDCRHQVIIDSEMNCTTCMEGFQDITDWRTHISSMHMVRSCACRTCNKWFANAEELNKHLQGVHPEHRQVDVEYRCLYCRKAFTDEEVLYIHTREHERTLSISRSESKLTSKGEIEIQKAVPDTTCPESDQKTLNDVCDAASTISPTSDCDQEKPSKAEEMKSLEILKGPLEGDHEKTPSSKKSFFLKKFQLEEKNMSTNTEAGKNKINFSDQTKSSDKTSPISYPKIVTARSIIDSLVTESLTKTTSFVGFSKMPPFIDPSKHSEGAQSPEFLLSSSSSDHPPKQPLLKDMLLQINPKSHITLGTETKLNSSQPRSKCVRDICDEIITHSFRESSPVGPTERLKIFDSIAFDPVPAKVDSPTCSKNNKVGASSRTSTDSNASVEHKADQDSHQLLVDSSDKASSAVLLKDITDSKKSMGSPEAAKRSTSPQAEASKVANENDPSADSTSKSTTKKDRNSPMQSILGKRSHPVDSGCQEVSYDVSNVAPASKNSVKETGDEEPPSKKIELQH